MNHKFIAGVIFTLSTGVCVLLKRKADKQYLNKKAVDIVQDEKSTEDLVAYRDAIEAIVLRDHTLKTEKDKIKTTFDEWKKTNRIDQQKKDLYLQEDAALKEFKSTFGYSEALSDLNRQKQEALDAFKTSIDYDEKIEALKNEIEAAKKKWESQQSLFASTDDDISDTVSKVKHAAEDAKDAAIKKAKEQISNLEKQLETETSIWDKKIQKTKREYEEKINREKNRLHEKTKKRIADLDESVDKAHADIVDKIQADRSEKAVDAITFYEDNCKLIETHDRIDELRALEIYHNTSSIERIAWWFNEHKWPKWSVAGLGFTPLLAAEWLLSCYGRFVIDILKAM